MPESSKIIALVTRIAAAQEAQWLERLRLAMPYEVIVPFRDLTSAQRRLVDIAIVANPDPAEIAQLPALVWVQSLWAGVERLVAELPGFRPPIVRLVDPELARTMGEAGLAWTYYLFRNMADYARQQRARNWSQLPYRPPSAVTVGILGLGALGADTARRILGAGFPVVGWSRSPKKIDGVRCYDGDAGLAEVLRQSDILLVLLPLTENTRKLLDAERLATLPEGAKIINFARGAIIDTGALVAALDAGAIAHAVLDVFEVEPLPKDDALWDHPSVTVLPHISAPTDAGTAAGIVTGNIALYRSNGIIPPAIDQARGY
ncbi:2-hydroxyacid dehydrogenase [Falsirhodobacter xinxiangensis]|uniref:2-hydroxyacid dehydrogenase n=1 Tax=Falsirhodobacter xinxiangensis TaxID=2530049 RepID=UPI001C704067|nr:glyoxylate/hydroxypyruvate reductase A [Rhodobacter xinxiangensis]